MATKRARAAELRNLASSELKAQIEQLRQELWLQRMKARDGSLQQTHHLSAGRRHIARIRTVLNEQERATAGSAKG